MIVTACLVLYSLLVILTGPSLLRRLTRHPQNPVLGVAAWLTAIVTVLISWAAALIVLLVQIAGHWDHRPHLLASCVAQLRVIATGGAGVLPRIALWGFAVVAAGAIGLIAARFVYTLAAMRSRSHRHAEAVHLVGRHTAIPDVVVLDSDRPAAYCVAGRPPAIVVTSAALATLNEPELCAVLAHERAHLTGSHHRIVAALRGLATVLPRVALISRGAEQVARLLEMCADDVAAGRHGRQALVAGLLAMSASTPAGTLGAADVATFERARRLEAFPPEAAGRGCAAALTTTMTMIATGPVVIAAMAHSGLLMCGM